MASCYMDDQISFVSEWVRVFLINNHPISLFDILSMSVSPQVFVRLFSMLFASRIPRVVAFYEDPFPLPLLIFQPLF